MSNNSKCLLGDGNPVKSRGLCSADYACARDAVKSKKTTWEKLQREGKCLASQKPRHKDKIDFFVKGKVKGHNGVKENKA